MRIPARAHHVSCDRGEVVGTALRAYAHPTLRGQHYPDGPVSAMIGPNSSQRSPLNFIICICLLMR